MSAVFMCDNCGELFSANTPGARTFTEQWDGDPNTRTQYNNAENHGALRRDIGPCCNLVPNEVKPRLALPPTKEA